MCDPVSIITSAVGLAASQAMKPDTPKVQPPTEPVKPPQATKMPEQQAVRAAAAGAGSRVGGGAGGPVGTMLTGMGGIDPATLNLGKSKLLGE